MRKALLIGTSKDITHHINNIIYFLNTSRNYNHIMTITCETTQKPTRAVIMGLIKQLLCDNQPGDELWFYYIGNVDVVNDVAIWPMDYDKNGFITDDDLQRELIDKLRVGVSLYMIMDCIHSGNGLDLRYMYNDKSKYIGNDSTIIKYNFKDWQLIESLTENRKYTKTLGNVFIISCCKEELDKISELGGLTIIFLKVLKSNYGNIKWKYLLKDLKCLLKIKGYNKIPQLSAGRPIDLNGLMFPNYSMVFC